MPNEQEITVKATVPMGNECYKLSSICLYWNVDLEHGVDTCMLFRKPMYHSNKCAECLDACKEEVEIVGGKPIVYLSHSKCTTKGVTS